MADVKDRATKLKTVKRDIKPEEYKAVARLFNVQNNITSLRAELAKSQHSYGEIVKELELPSSYKFVINFETDVISWEEAVKDTGQGTEAVGEAAGFKK